MSRLSLTYFEIDLPRCDLSYGVSPCTASIPTTGAIKCFNTKKTCQDRANFSEDTVTIRFAKPAAYLPADIIAIPCIADVDVSTGIISLGGDLGQRGTLRVTCFDQPFSDTGPLGDPYRTERGYDAWARGTLFGKFRARDPYVRNCAARLITGYVGQTLEQMETRHYVMDSFDGPQASGQFSFIAKDPLKLLDGDRALAPKPSNGYLSLAVTNTATSLVLLPVGVANQEYPVTGHIAIGGKEIVYFERDPYTGIDANTQLMLAFNGTDASTTMTDSSGNGRNGTAVGNAQLDTANKKYGTAALLLDGTGDYVTVADNAAWTFAGNFTIDCWAYFDDLAAARTIFSHSSGNLTNQYRLVAATNGALTFEVISSGSTIITLSSAAGAVTAAVWTHLAVVRSGNVFTIYRNGVAVATVTDSDTIPNFTSTFKVGAAGDGASDYMKGAIDTFRIQSAAVWTAGFADALPGPYNNTTPDTLTITRAQYNTEAVSHEEQDRAQLCLGYDGVDPADIIADLAKTYASVSPDFIPLPDWQLETDSFLQRLATAIIPEPTPVKQLVEELIQQFALAVWWDDLDQQIKLQVMRGILTDVARFSERNIIRGSMQTKEQPDKRVSRVLTYYAINNPLRPVDEPDNYRSIEMTVDLLSEDDYGSIATKRIFSRWIPAFGRSVASRLNAIVIGRFKNPPRRVNFDVFRDDVGMVIPGRGARLEGWFIQDDTGARVDLPIQFTRVVPRPDRLSTESEEFQFDVPADFNDRIITIDVSTLNFNLRDAYDSIYPPPEDDTEVTCRIADGAIVGSSSVATPAFIVGDWPSGTTITIEIEGRIQGRGGDGGAGSIGTGSAGQAGGDALYTRRNVTITGSGEIYGGAGGGGASGGSFSFGGSLSGGDGGGGQGYQPGSRGSVPATTESRGTGAGGSGLNSGQLGGAGGSISDSPTLQGQPGATGYTSGPYVGAPGGAGGAAGKAIDGDSYVTETGSLTIIGARVN